MQTGSDRKLEIFYFEGLLPTQQLRLPHDEPIKQELTPCERIDTDTKNKIKE